MKSWGTFKNEMKAERRQNGYGVGKKNEEGSILERQELVVPRLSSEVSDLFSGLACYFIIYITIDLFRLYILFSQNRSCANTQKVRSFLLFIAGKECM